MAHTTSASARPQITFNQKSVDEITIMAVEHMTTHALRLENLLADAVNVIVQLPGRGHEDATRYIIQALIECALVMNSVCMLFPGEVMALRAQERKG